MKKKQPWYFDFTDQEKAEFRREYPSKLRSNIFAQRVFSEHIRFRKPYRKFKRIV
jgi:hypothetical protein